MVKYFDNILKTVPKPHSNINNPLNLFNKTKIMEFLKIILSRIAILLLKVYFKIEKIISHE